jgi:hypothetical protein
VHAIRVQGGTILEIHRIDYGPQTDLLRRLWTGERRNVDVRRRLLAYARDDQVLRAKMMKIFGSELPVGEKIEQMRLLLPANLHDAVAAAVESEEALRADSGQELGWPFARYPE